MGGKNFITMAASVTAGAIVLAASVYGLGVAYNARVLEQQVTCYLDCRVKRAQVELPDTLPVPGGLPEQLTPPAGPSCKAVCTDLCDRD